MIVLHSGDPFVSGNDEFEAPHLAAVAHHCLEAVLRVQVPPLDEAVLGAVEYTDNNVLVTTQLQTRRLFVMLL